MNGGKNPTTLHCGFPFALSFVGLWLGLTGAAQKSGQKVFAMEFLQVLRGEHKPIQRALNVLESMRKIVQQGGNIDVHDVNALLLFLHCFADGCHQTKEESVLFPALRLALQNRNRMDATGSINIENLFEAHKQERELIEKTQVALFAQQGADFAENARRLIDLVAEHIVEEERILFPTAEKILTPQEATAVQMQIQEANARFGECQITLLLDMLSQLEEKFMMRAA